MHRFKILGMTDEPGHCDLCGTFCPRRRVAVELRYDDGSMSGDVKLWGVVCAAEARSGRRDSTIARQLQAEAEEAGDYTGPARSRRRPAMPHARRQTRREAARLAAIADADARAVWFRTSSHVPAAIAGEPGDTFDHVAAADYRYRHAGRRPEGSYLVANDAGDLARVDGNDAADVARFDARGYSRRLEPATWHGLQTLATA